jgi:hypothetical protein
MKRLGISARLVRYLPALGWLLVSGCLANAERNLDRVLSPGALDNALVLPYTRVAGLAELVARLLGG